MAFREPRKRALAGFPQNKGTLGSSPGSSPQEPIEQNLLGTFNTIMCIMNMGEEMLVCCLKSPLTALRQSTGHVLPTVTFNNAVWDGSTEGIS